MSCKQSVTAALIVAGIGIAAPAGASCGSAFCVLNTQWDTQGMSNAPGRLGLDLRYEYVKQDQLRSGKRNISPTEDTSDTTELQTINRNLLATIDYSLDGHWGLSASLPVVKRRHSHIDDPTGAASFESWNFTRTGDARVLGRYQFDPPTPSDSFGLQFGVKLPTGSHTVTNSEGTLAERSLQPGTGSSDLIVGGYYAYRPQFRGLGWFGQALYQRPVSTKDEFRPGSQLTLTGGLNYPVGDAATLLFQINALRKGRDTGANAEPDLSGGRFVYASPGISYALSRETQFYGFVQLPLLRDVNGAQLVAKQAFVAGLSVRF